MANGLKIAIIGDFNFSFNAHHATNLAIEHSKSLLDLDVNYYWIRSHEAANFKLNQLKNYDAVWIAPGPFENIFFMNGIIQNVIYANLPCLITGEAYKILIEVLVAQNNLNPNNEKLISDNLSSEDQFEKIEVIPVSNEIKKLYKSMNRIELTSSRYSLYPQLLSYLTKDIIDIEAINQFEDAEVISLKNHSFFVASMSNIQICSTREMPHPLITAFLNIAEELKENDRLKTGA